MSIGNRVWFDTNNNGVIDGLETGISGVVVNLYQEDDTGTFVQIDTDTTDAGGYYLFDDLIPGNYYVEISSTNFGVGQPLEDLSSSTGSSSNDTDRNDNGIDDTLPEVNGIVSNVVTLSVDSQPTGETDRSSDVGDGPNRIGTNGETDDNSDITIDFGFVGALMSVGNRVWFDPNNNGIIDATESGIANVTVNLYRDTDANGIPDGGAIETRVTDANGYYIFDGLTPGNYIVALPNANFASNNPLEGLLSSSGNGNDNQQDSNVDENGIDTRNPTYGLISDTITLTINNETDLEVDYGTAGDGSNGETPTNSDLTVDFGLYEPMAIGNRVWFDTDNDATRDNNEVGINGVIVNLYQDDGTGTFVQIATTTTDGNGYYIFDALGEGDYYVEVAPTNFQTGGVLINLNSSPSSNDNNGDTNDNGIDDADPATNGILSNITSLILGAEPRNENDPGPAGDGRNGEANNNSDLSIDFGFSGGTMALGNRVWIDDGAGGGIARDGIRDANEVVVGDVNVSLYSDSNADGIPDGDAIATTTTDGNGYYIFDGLAPGNYLVGLDADNFANSGVLSGYTSTTTNPSNVVDTDNDDDGIDNENITVSGLLSSTITLQLTTEPITEPDLGPDGNGSNGETDDNSNLTVDFGLYKPLSIGNRIWFDSDDSGTLDDGESGIGGVTITLYRDDDLNGIPDIGEDIATDITDGSGYYLFDDLFPGDYIVVIESTNFQAGGALEGFSSSTGNTTDETDSDDNGIDDGSPEINGILSDVITLVEDNAPIGEVNVSGDVDDGPNFRGNQGESDNNSNLTIDFGFVAGSMSLGNRVWLDDGAGGGNTNNGIQDGSETGIENVIVNLFTDVNNDGNPDGDILFTTTTDATGHYLFDRLAPGNYLVQIDPSNFEGDGALFGLFSSTGNANDDIDSNDNGIDNTEPVTNGILSTTVSLVANNEPTSETDIGADGNGSNGETDENANLTIDFGFAVAYDFGDAPDSYGTTLGSNGAQHVIISTLQLGNEIDDEADGQPDVNADGDDINKIDDEDSINFSTLVAGTTVDLDVAVFNNTGTDANLALWIDFDANGLFDDGEGFITTVPSATVSRIVPLTIVVPIDADVTSGGNTYARVRLTTDDIDTTDAIGFASDGEVEDYVVAIDPPGLVITKTDGEATIEVGQETTYTITIGNSGLDVINRNFVDNIPTDDPDGFDPDTITWTCSASGGASCITGQPAGTADAGVGSIDTFIDIPRAGEIIFEITATLRPNYRQSTVTNVAQLESGESGEDVNDVISDMLEGRKSGIRVGNRGIRWTIVWVNTGNTARTATITDALPANQIFDGNLDCDANGTSIEDSCTYDPATDTITWEGTVDIGETNRIEIAFDVRVSSGGSFRNTSNIEMSGQLSEVDGRVRIGSSDDDDDDGDEGDLLLADEGMVVDDQGIAAPIIADPIIVKLVDPSLIQPGEQATWTITVTNPGDIKLSNISLTDDVPSPLQVVSTSASIGSIAVSNQAVNINIPELGGGQTAVITILTRLDPNFDQTIITNTVEDASATLLVVRTLPATGQAPYWTIWLRYGMGLIVVVGMLFGMWRIWLYAMRHIADNK